MVLSEYGWSVLCVRVQQIWQMLFDIYWTVQAKVTVASEAYAEVTVTMPSKECRELIIEAINTLKQSGWVRAVQALLTLQ